MAKSIKQLIRRDIETIGAEWIDKQPVLLGDYSATVQTSTPGVFYARQYNGKVIEVHNTANVPPTFDLHVIIGRKKSLPNIWQIIEVRETYLSPAAFGQIGFHHSQHEFPNGDIVWSDRKQILPLTVLVSDAAGFIVVVFGSVVHTATGIHKISTQLLDLSSYVVTAGAKFVSIETDDEGVLSVHAGVAFGAPSIATDADIPVPDPGKYLIAFVLLYEGQTELSNNDIRVPFPLGGAATSHAHDATDVTYIPAVLADWIYTMDPGDVDDALDQLAERVTDLEGGGSSPMEDQIAAATGDDSPANGDEFGYRDIITGFLKKLTWAEILNALGAVFDTFYASIGHTHEVDQRSDIFNDGEGDPAAIGTAADGTSTYAARRDHVHAMTTLTGKHYLPLGVFTHISPVAAASSPASPYAVGVDRSITLVQWVQTVFVAGTNDGSNYWTFNLIIADVNNSPTTIASFNTSAGSGSVWIKGTVSSFSTNPVTTTYYQIYIQAVKTGTPGSVYINGPLLEIAV